MHQHQISSVSNKRRLTQIGMFVLLISATGAAFATAAADTGIGAIDGFVALYIFMLAAFTGHEIIGKVPVILHTPLMSGSNFVHGIVLVGAMIALGHADTMAGKIIGFIAVLLGAGNAAGGYVVTERMLEMFKPSTKKAGG
jgi:H+-translocating NAD(P) transhydrogenase subunit alpha